MNLKFEIIHNFKSRITNNAQDIQVSYELFGQPLHSAPIVLVNHALTGNSDVASQDKGWWREIVGINKLIDLNAYTVITFNIPGNGYDGTFINNYQDYTATDIAEIFYAVLQRLNVNKLFAIIGGSLGGGVAWEMATLYPTLADYIIPVAANYISNDWIIGHNYVQESILLNSNQPLKDARKMAMLFYRTPQSFSKKFNRTKAEGGKYYNVETWLEHHAEKLENRLELPAYLFMNHLLTTVNAVRENETVEETFGRIQSTIIQISVNTDLFFTPEENVKTQKLLDDLNIKNQHHQIQSIDGHDAFLIEHEQLTQFLSPIFKH